MLAKILALIIHEVVSEYRSLDQPTEPQRPEPCTRPHADEHRYDPASTTAAQVERAAGWDHDTRPPATRIGFNPPAGTAASV